MSSWRFSNTCQNFPIGQYGKRWFASVYIKTLERISNKFHISRLKCEDERKYRGKFCKQVNMNRSYIKYYFPFGYLRNFPVYLHIYLGIILNINVCQVEDVRMMKKTLQTLSCGTLKEFSMFIAKLYRLSCTIEAK